ncbi:MAG: Two component, sigma54 specific, transcriptional regulator, Fis family [candidate division TM6 bacterium GW2011_GWF2_32_72]|nr:MAG: Two component, sigma54 specific, transcriptional regulator, Fis family [candidate division TM6 bacterium GW2011_GWF2_32_72]
MFDLSILKIFFGHPITICLMSSISSLIWTGIITFLLKTKTKNKKNLILFILVLGSSLAIALSWNLSTIDINFYNFRTPFIHKTMRFTAWIFILLQAHALFLFIKHLVNKHYPINLADKLMILPSLTLITFLGITGFKSNPELYNFISKQNLHKITTLYVLFTLTLPCLFYGIQKAYSGIFPKILKRQLKIFIFYIITPYFIGDSLQLCASLIELDQATKHILAYMSFLILAFGSLYFVSRVMKLRFLNTEKHVTTFLKNNFAEQLTDILEQLSVVTDVQELKHITRRFFKESFGLNYESVRLHIRPETGQDLTHTNDFVIQSIEKLHNFNPPEIINFIKHEKVLIFDELDFDNFYESNPNTELLAKFMKEIELSIYIPIYQSEKLIAHITVKSSENIFSHSDRSQMLIFAGYLGNIINLIRQRSLHYLIAQEKELKDELHKKHSEITQYKESIKSFIKDSQSREIGIIFFKNKKFSFGNQSAKEMFDFDPNTQDGHDSTKKLKQIITKVIDYKTVQTDWVLDKNHKKMIVTGIPQLDQNSIILTIHYPEISDILKNQIDNLSNPTDWDYLLYLETTKSGKLINKLIPSTKGPLLDFKLDILKASLSPKATLLNLPEDDLIPTVELLHDISLRDELHILKLSNPNNDNETTIKLFGINSLFLPNPPVPLLKLLDKKGTLFIQNIHNLNLEAQEKLAEFIKYGFFHIFKDEHKIFSDVRIICSSNQNLEKLTQERLFSAKLFKELHQTTLIMPKIAALKTLDLNQLIEGFSNQNITQNALKNLLELSDQEKEKLIKEKPIISLQELKKRTHQMLAEKSKKNNLTPLKTYWTTTENSNDPIIEKASKLGKRALKDEKLMKELWTKLPNQNKIAELIGVNRSSVSRRFKQYELE